MTRRVTTEIKVIWLLTTAYALFDVVSSASAGNERAQRSSVYIILVILMTALLYFCLTRKKLYIRFDAPACLLFLFAVYYAFDFFIVKGMSGWSSIGNLAVCLWWFLTYVYFYNLDEAIEVLPLIKRFMLFMFLLYCVFIVYGSVNIRQNHVTVSYARVGYVYHLLTIVPLLFYERQQRTRLLVISLLVMMTLFSFKRGAVIICPIMILSFIITENGIGLKQNNILRTLGLVVFFVAVFYAIDQYSGGYLSQRFSTEELRDGSGRSYLIRTSLQNIRGRSLFELVFGIPSNNEVANEAGIHNEWIGHLHNEGLIGLTLYALILWQILKTASRLCLKKSVLAPMAVVTCVYTFLVGLFSGWYFMHCTFYVIVNWSILERLGLEDESELVYFRGNS